MNLEIKQEIKKLKALCGILGIGLISLTTSAQDSLFRENYLNHLKKLEKYTPITKEEIQSDASRFKIINSGLKEYINKIYIIDKKDFLKERRSGHIHISERVICLEKNYNNRILFHESGHNRHLALNKSKSDFSKKWEQVADFKYGGYNFYFSKDKFKEIAPAEGIPVWEDKTLGPKNGCLIPMAGENLYEDVAIFVESLGYEETPENVKELYYQFKIKEDEILKENNDTLEFGLNLEFYSEYFPLYFADTTDKRYQQKIDLLKEYNFFIKEEHAKLSKNLGSLNYLLKEKK